MLDPPCRGGQAAWDGTLRPRAGDHRLRAVLVGGARAQGVGDSHAVPALGHALLPGAERPPRVVRRRGVRPVGRAQAAQAPGPAATRSLLGPLGRPAALTCRPATRPPTA